MGETHYHAVTKSEEQAEESDTNALLRGMGAKLVGPRSCYHSIGDTLRTSAPEPEPYRLPPLVLLHTLV